MTVRPFLEKLAFQVLILHIINQSVNCRWASLISINVGPTIFYYKLVQILKWFASDILTEPEKVSKNYQVLPVFSIAHYYMVIISFNVFKNLKCGYNLLHTY